MKLTNTILCFALLLFINSSLFAQFRGDLRKANKEYELHAYNLAIKSFREALDRRPEDVEALSKIADSYRHLNQLEDAEKYYVRAVSKKDVEPMRRLEYAHVLKALGKYDEARKWYVEYARTDAAAGNHFAESVDFAKNQQNAASVYTAVDEFVNSSSSDFGPAFYNNSNQVVFASARVDIQRGSTNWTGDARNQLFIASVGRNGYLEAPYFLKDDTRNAFNEGPVTFSNDGRWVAFSRNNLVDGTRPLATSGMNLSLFVAEVTSSGDWINEKAFPYNGTNFSVGFPSFSPDGNALYFSSNRPDGFGEYDIYVSYRVGGTGNNWGNPENLGAIVNTAGSEITPYYDGTNLFFASDWHNGLGGYDAFRAENANGRWGRIFHLGNGINSPRDDYGFIYNASKNLGYVVSNRLGGRGNEDIYKVNKAADNVIVRVKNASDGTPVVNAVVDFAACNEGAYQTDAQGTYSFQAVQGLDCNLIIRKEGYQSKSLPITTAGARQNREYEITLSRTGEEYIGRVVNYSSRLPLEGVTVTAVNQATGTLLETVSDANGEYMLAISPNVVYVVRYSRPGFRDINRTVRANGSAGQDALGIIEIADVNTILPPSTNSGSGVNNGGGTGTGNTAIPSGYSVQVAAVNQPNLAQYPDLANFGDVYTKKEGTKYKVRVGIFATREEAARALTLIKNQGYKGPFIVQEAGVASTGDNLQPKGNGNSGNPTTTTPTTSSRYKIQLAAYSNLKNFDAAKVQGLGNIEEAKRGKLTVKYLAGYTTLEETRQALREAKAAGFKDAYMVEDMNGALKKVQ